MSWSGLHLQERSWFRGESGDFYKDMPPSLYELGTSVFVLLCMKTFVYSCVNSLNSLFFFFIKKKKKTLCTNSVNLQNVDKKSTKEKLDTKPKKQYKKTNFNMKLRKYQIGTN